MPAAPAATSYAANMFGLLCVAFAMQPGTGGLSTLEYCKARDEMGYPLVRTEPLVRAQTEATVRTPVEDLERIRAFLRPAVANLAHALGVSRQAVYDWQAGKPVTAENASRLADIGRAADVLAGEGVAASAQLLRRPVKSGQTLLDIVREGGSAEQAAGVLAGIIRREAQQRDRLSARLASRPRRNVGNEDLGSPILDEVATATL